MTKARKTIEVESMLNEVNEMLSTGITDANVRMGMCAVLESLLMKSGNYNGFRYLREHEVPDGHKPGINTVHGDFDEDTAYMLRFKNTDDSRRCYF